MIVLITGGTGLIGMALRGALITAGHEVRILTRQPSDRKTGLYNWDFKKGILDQHALTNVSAVVHLAGASVARGKWTSKRKKVLIDSRVESSQLILRSLLERGQQLKIYISASGTGFYGNRPNETVNEGSSKGLGFLSDVCNVWEDIGRSYTSIGANVYINRIGIVLSEKGGFVQKMKPLFKWRIASEMGSGRQKTSWIHIDDLIAVFLDQIEGKLTPGTYNAVATESITHHALMYALSQRMNSRIWLPNIPVWALNLMLGELAGELVANQEVVPQLLIDQGHKFRYGDLKSAIETLNR